MDSPALNMFGYIICEDRSIQLPWIRFTDDDLLGYGYACLIDDFLDAVPILSERVPRGYELLNNVY